MCLVYCQNVSFNAEMMLGQLDHNDELLQMFGHPSTTRWTCWCSYFFVTKNLDQNLCEITYFEMFFHDTERHHGNATIQV